MGINTFSFDGVSSDTYGVYITEGASYNAPERAVEMLEIPGRNGHFALDQGRFENVEVTYHVFIDGSSETDYSSNLSDLRNWLCSKVGYARLTDSYNPNEYRMAVYKSGLEVDATSIQSGEFDVVFDCKPQRWLTSGETKVTLLSGDSINNPTLFSSSPLIEAYGYGEINLGSDTITVDSGMLGNIVLANTQTMPNAEPGYFYNATYDNTLFNSGDVIKVAATQFKGEFYSAQKTVSSAQITATSGYSGANTTVSVITDGWKVALVVTNYGDEVFYQGTARDISVTLTLKITYTDSTTETGAITWTYSYDGINKFTITYDTSSAPFAEMIGNFTRGAIIGTSTVTSLGNPVYIDLDIGEAYNIINGEAVSVNNTVRIPAELPTLKSGNTVVTYENTFTKIDIVPRWWKI